MQLECSQEKPIELVSEWPVCQERKNVKRFEQSNGLDTALYKNISSTFTFFSTKSHPARPIFMLIWECFSTMSTSILGYHTCNTTRLQTTSCALFPYMTIKCDMLKTRTKCSRNDDQDLQGRHDGWLLAREAKR